MSVPIGGASFNGSSVADIEFNGSQVFAAFFNGNIFYGKTISSSVLTVTSDYVVSNVIYDYDHTYTNPIETVSGLKNKLDQPNSALHIFDEGGNELSDNSAVGTKASIVYSVDGVVIDTKTFVQKGDLNKDGSIDQADEDIIIAYNQGTIVITDQVILDAMDVNDDGEINYKDRAGIINFVNRLGS